MKQSPQQRAVVRVCGSCEWIYRAEDEAKDAAGPGTRHGCPKCGFASYGAHYVYGPKCYAFEVTQEPWMKRKLDAYRVELLNEIERTAPKVRELRAPLFLDL